jgi:disulfide bond formation protein DsbB
MSRIQKHGLKIIFAQAFLAMLGSLYYGFYGDPVLNILTMDLFNPDNALPPCTLCRYARILMYPLVLISFIWLWKKTRDVVDYIIPFAIIGIPLEIYHYSLQKFPIAVSSTCTRSNPCNALSVDYFGFITIPFLCLTAFTVILLIALLIKRANKKSL